MCARRLSRGLTHTHRRHVRARRARYGVNPYLTLDSTPLGGGVASAASRGNERRVLRTWGRQKAGPRGLLLCRWPDLSGRNRNACRLLVLSRLAIAQQQGGTSPAAGMTLGRPSRTSRRALGDCTRTKDFKFSRKTKGANADAKRQTNKTRIHIMLIYSQLRLPLRTRMLCIMRSRMRVRALAAKLWTDTFFM